MAGNNEEVVTLVRIDTGESVRTVAELKKYVSDLKKGLNELVIGTDEYNNTLRALQQAQDAQKDAMNYGVETVKAAKGSYNDLVHTMRELKQEWRSTNDEAKRTELGQQINDINNKLKTFDESVGVYGRSVGDYSNKIQEAFSAMGGSMGKAAAGGLKQFKLGLDAVSKTPVIAIIGVIVAILDKLIKTLKGSEDGMNKLAGAMGVFGGITEGVTRALQWLADGLAAVINFYIKLYDKLGLVTDRMKEKQALAEREIQLARDQRAFLIEEAKTERDIAADRADAVDRENKTLDERLAALDRVAKAEEKLMLERKRMAQEAYDIYNDQVKYTKNSAEVEQKRAELQAAVYKAETAYNQALRQNTRERQRIHKEQLAQTKERIRAAKEEKKAIEQAAKEKLNAEKQYLQELLGIVVDGSKTQFKIKNTIALKEKQAAETDAKNRIRDAQELARALELIEKTFQLKMAKNREEYQQKQLDAEILQMQNIRDGYRKGSTEYLAEQTAILKRQYESLTKLAGESDEAFLARRIAAFKALQLALEEQVEAERNTEILKRQNDMALLEEGSIEYLEKSVALKQYELDTIHQLESESEEEFRSRQLEAQRAYNDEQKALVQARVSMTQSWASNVTGLMGSIADAYEALSDDEEKAAEETKGIRIAMATIDTISGAIGAFMTTSEQIGGIPGLIAGALAAASVTATGIANIAKIKATKVKGGSGSGSSAVVSAPPPVQQVPVTRTATSATEEARLDQIASKQKVYLVYSDVQEAGEYVEVVQNEAEF